MLLLAMQKSAIECLGMKQNKNSLVPFTSATGSLRTACLYLHLHAGSLLHLCGFRFHAFSVQIPPQTSGLGFLFMLGMPSPLWSLAGNRLALQY